MPLILASGSNIISSGSGLSIAPTINTARVNISGILHLESGAVITTSGSGITFTNTITMNLSVSGRADYLNIRSGTILNPIISGAIIDAATINNATFNPPLTISNTLTSGAQINRPIISGALTLVSGTNIVTSGTVITLTPSLDIVGNLQAAGYTTATNVVYNTSGDLINVRNFSGIIQFSGSTLDDIFTSVLSVKGRIIVMPGTYPLSTSFSGWGITSNIMLDMAPTAVILVPTDYAGVVFNVGTRANGLTNNTSQSIVKGGLIIESGASPGRLWKGWQILVSSADVNQGVSDVTLRDMKFQNAGDGIEINVGASGNFANNNYFDNVKVFNSNVGVRFVNNTSGDTSETITNNVLNNVLIQAAANSSGGFIGIIGNRNAFVNCTAWDFNTPHAGAARTATIVSGADNTLIVGGIMTYWNFVNSGANLNIMGEKWTGTRSTTGIFTNVLTAAVNTGTSRFITVDQGASGSSYDTIVRPFASGTSNTLSLYSNSGQTDRLYIQHALGGVTIGSQLLSGHATTIKSVQLLAQNAAAGPAFERQSWRMDATGNFMITHWTSANWEGVITSGQAIANGTATALTAAPAGYMHMTVSGVERLVPFYAKT